MTNRKEDPESMATGPMRRPSTLASLLSGSVGGAAQVLVGQPLVSI